MNTSQIGTKFSPLPLGVVCGELSRTYEGGITERSAVVERVMKVFGRKRPYR
jgi:hypothetical protein